MPPRRRRESAPTLASDFDDFVRMQRLARDAARRDLAAWFADASPGDIDRKLGRALVAIAERNGQASAAAGADFYDAAREHAGAPGRYRAYVGASIAADTVAAGWSTVADALADRGADAALTAALALVDVATLADGRHVIAANAARDKGARWGRVPVGKTCAWCVMLAGRGAVYRNEMSAGGARAFHRDCDCQPCPTWDGDDGLPPAWHASGVGDIYTAATAGMKTVTAAGALKAIRRFNGGAAVADGVQPKPDTP